MTDSGDGADRRDIDVIASAVPDCPRCAGPGLLSADIPQTSWSDGTPIGIKCHAVVVLCPACDLDPPEAGALITFLTVHGSIDESDLEEFGRLLKAWTSVARPPAVDTVQLEAEYQLWLRGEL